MDVVDAVWRERKSRSTTRLAELVGLAARTCGWSVGQPSTLSRTRKSEGRGKVWRKGQRYLTGASMASGLTRRPCSLDTGRGVSPIPGRDSKKFEAEIDFCCQTFGAVEGVRRPGPDGRVAHAMLRLGPAMLMREAEWPTLPSRAPNVDGSSPVAILCVRRGR
jgi:hypothetical protein